MPIIAKRGGSGGDFVPAPAGTYRAVLVDVVDLGIVETTWNGKSKKAHRVRLVWQIDEPMEDGRYFVVGERYTLSLAPVAALRKMLETWIGKPFTSEIEAEGFDVESMLGKSGLITIVHNKKGDATYSNVASVAPLMKGMPPMEPKDYVRKVDRDPQPKAQEPADPFTNYDEMNPPPIEDGDIPF